MNNFNYAILCIVLTLSLLLNFINKITIKNLKIKRLYLFINRAFFVSKNSFVYIIRGVIFILITSLQILLLKHVMNFYESKWFLFDYTECIKKILVCFLGVIISFKIFFIISILIFMIIKKDLKNYIKTLSWIECRDDFSLYTKIVRPIYIAFIDCILYVALLPYIISRLLHINFLLSVISVAIIYAIGKSILCRKREHKILMFVFFVVAVFVLNLVYGYTQNILCPFIGFIILLWFWIFKK